MNQETSRSQLFYMIVNNFKLMGYILELIVNFLSTSTFNFLCVI